MDNYKTIFREHSNVVEINQSGKQHVAIIAGGMSAEREVSLVSSKSVTEALLQAGYRVTLIDMGADISTVLTKVKPDVVFNCLHGTYGEDGCLPGLLNIMRIPYTNSGVLASALGFNKLKSKELFVAHDIKMPDTIIVSKSENINNDPMVRPYVIKPISQGSSIGVEIILDGDNFHFADYKFPYGDKVIVEKYIKGRELQVAVLNGKALGILEIKLLKSRFNDYNSKYKAGYSEHIVPAPLPKKINNQLLSISEQAFALMGCKGAVRMEFMMDENQELYILEVNTHPGLTPLSSYPEILNYYGINLANLCEELLKAAAFEQ